MARHMNITPVDPFSGHQIGPRRRREVPVVRELVREPDVAGDTDPVPKGRWQLVVEWVGDDHDRAMAAYATEVASSRPRSSLLAALQSVISPPQVVAPDDQAPGYDAPDDRGTEHASDGELGGSQQSEAPA